MQLHNNGITLMYAVNDTSNGNSVPSLPLGETEDGATILAKAVFADQSSAERVAQHMDNQPGSHPGRFEVTPIEIWRPTDIEIYVRDRIREYKKGEGPKLIIPGV